MSGRWFSALFTLLGVAHAIPVPFRRVFAPQDGVTSPVERSFRSDQCLNGEWQFQPVPSAKENPTLASPQADLWEKTPVRIPSPWNVNAFPVESKQGGDFRCFPSYPEAWERVEAGWLRRTFTVPNAWRGRRLILRFNAVAGDAQVFVNGKPVARHFDLFLPFEVDVTDAVRFGGSNELRVGVRKASLADVPGKYGRRPYQGGSMWGQAIAGIWQDVFLTAVSPVRVTDVFVKPDVAAGVLSASVTLRNDTDRTARVRVTGDVRPWTSQAGKGTLDAPEPKGVLGSRVLATSPQTVSVPPHRTSVVNLSAPTRGKLKPWGPGAPNLYDLVCRVEGHDVKSTRFGWRQVTFDGTKVLLNGKPLVMRGDSWHFMGIPQMTRRYAWAWFKTLQDAGLNAVRLHAQPYPSFYLDMADEMGILVLDETAVWASDGGPKMDDPAFWADTQRHLRDLIHRDRNHPSVFGWSVSNEVMAVVRNVFHAPKEVENQADRMNGVWAAICRAEDPTRVWISADGEEDGHGALPVSVIHYGDRGTMERANARGKPWGVGEAGPAYYGTPKQIAEMAKDPHAYLSFADRMEGVAKVSYASLKDQNDLGASYRSVFNLVWYGLKPLELGLRDTSRPPTLEDGISFPPFVEGQPGVQPERLGPYCTTLNPGYDPKLPLYEPWPLFEAIRDAAAEPPVEFAPRVGTGIEVIAAQPRNLTSVRVLSATQGTLARALTDLGVTIDEASATLFLDGANPPGPEAKTLIDRALASGQTVVLWGADAKKLPALSALLPRPLELTARQASSLVATPDPLTAGLTPDALYFSELNPSTILSAGLAGPLLQGAKTLLRACDTDWRRWNGQAETVKTAMVLRSEREAKPSGVALAEVPVSSGRLILCNLPADAPTAQAVSLNRTILGNLGLVLGEGIGGRNLLRADGTVDAALTLGPFPAITIEAALASDRVRPDSAAPIKAGVVVDGRPWVRLEAGAEGKIRLPSESSFSSTYLSFWVYSPKSLDDLLLDPHLPTVDLSVGAVLTLQLWLNEDKVEATNRLTDEMKVPLRLRSGWNHVLIKAVRGPHMEDVGSVLRLVSNQADYQKQLRLTTEQP